MSAGTPVPVTPSVIDWAISESGYTLSALAILVGVAPETLRAWTRGQTKPKLTELRKLAAQLERPLAMFLLPEPPASSRPLVEFRSIPRDEHRELFPVELRSLREAARLQKVLSWLNRELDIEPSRLPRLKTSASPLTAASETRERLRVTAKEQSSWSSSSSALRAWRSLIEESGVFVLMLPMGKDACRGFSLWDESAPLIAANTSWSPEARVFTLFHEYGHLLTRTPSACTDGKHRRGSAYDDPAERWCERFAASVIIPPDELRRFLSQHGWQAGKTIEGLNIVRGAAKHFRASLSATTLSLIELGAATWGLYGGLPRTDGPGDGGGGAGRSRPQIKRDQYGLKTLQTFLTGLRRDVVSSGDVLDYLDVPPQALVEAVQLEPSSEE